MDLNIYIYSYLQDKNLVDAPPPSHPITLTSNNRISWTQIYFWTQIQLEFACRAQIFGFSIFRGPFSNFLILHVLVHIKRT